MRFLGRFLFRILRFAAIVYGILFAVFYFDLDGKFLYYIWQPLILKRYDTMKRPDVTSMPYSMKEDA